MELILFYIASAVALLATVFALTRSNAAHALIYLNYGAVCICNYDAEPR